MIKLANEIILDGKKINYEVKYRKVNYAKIRIDPNGLVRIIAPHKYEPRKLLFEKKSWVTQKLEEIEKIKKEFSQNDKLLLFGKFVDLRVVYTNVKKVQIEEKNSEIILTVNKAAKGLEIKYLKKWMHEKLRALFEEYLQYYSKKLGVRYNKIFLRRRTKKWGGCSNNKNLSFNLLNAALPLDLIKYVAIHELTHLIIPRHSTKFWSIVESLCPDYKDKERELKKYWIIAMTNEFWKTLLNL